MAANPANASNSLLLKQSQPIAHGSHEIRHAIETLRSFDCHRPLGSHFGNEFVVIAEALFGKKCPAPANASVFQRLGATSDFVLFHRMESPDRDETPHSEREPTKPKGTFLRQRIDWAQTNLILWIRQ